MENDTTELKASITAKNSTITTLTGEKTTLTSANTTLTNTNTALTTKVAGLEADTTALKATIATRDETILSLNDEIDELLQQLEDCGKTPVTEKTRSADLHGIKFANNIVSDKAEISVILPNNEKTVSVNIVIYDITGNIVFETTARGGEVSWNLTNTAGRFVANGSYLVIAEAKSINGKIYRYSAKLGVRR